MARVEQSVEQGTWLLEESTRKRPPASVARSLVQVVSNRVPVRLLNTLPEPVTVYGGTEIATLEQVTVPVATERTVTSVGDTPIDERKWELLSSLVGEARADISAEERDKFLARAPLTSMKVAYPLQLVAMDILGQFPESYAGNSYILVVADYFTTWTEAYPIGNQEATTVAKKLTGEFFFRFLHLSNSTPTRDVILSPKLSQRSASCCPLRNPGRHLTTPNLMVSWRGVIAHFSLCCLPQLPSSHISGRTIYYACVWHTTLVYT